MFTNFGKDEPSSAMFSEEDCLEMLWNGFWNDQDCYSYNYFLVEYECGIGYAFGTSSCIGLLFEAFMKIQLTIIKLDFNACASNPCHSQATCTDLAAPSLGFSCSCNSGYTGDGVSTCTSMSFFFCNMILSALRLQRLPIATLRRQCRVH